MEDTKKELNRAKEKGGFQSHMTCQIINERGRIAHVKPQIFVIDCDYPVDKQIDKLLAVVIQ